jgi:hypothetical protein
MFEQLTDLVKQFGGDAVVNNPAVPNEHNEAVMQEASGSIFEGLKEMASGGNMGDLAGMLAGKTGIDMNNPVVAGLAEKVSGNLGEKFGLSSEASGGILSSLLPKVLGGLVGKAQDPNQPDFNVSDIVSGLTGGSQGGGGGLMDMVTKYGGMLGLDKDGDGQVGISDAVAAVTGSGSDKPSSGGGLGGLLGKLFGK